jgi:hypothetical protein
VLVDRCDGGGDILSPGVGLFGGIEQLIGGSISQQQYFWPASLSLLLKLGEETGGSTIRPCQANARSNANGEASPRQRCVNGARQRCAQYFIITLGSSMVICAFRCSRWMLVVQN